MINVSICFSKENNNIKMSNIHMTIIRITIFISKMCFYVLVYNKYNSNGLYHCNGNIYFQLFVNIFTSSFSLFHIIVPLLVTKCVFGYFFYNHVHNQYHDHDHENINQMLLHSLMGMEQNQSDMFHDFLSKAHCFVQPSKGMKYEINS